MTPDRTIDPPVWMREPRSIHLMRTLNQNAFEPQALFVGGCVRNALIGKEVTDIDIATRHSPEQVQELCEAAGYKVLPTGVKHGTVTVIIDNKPFEVTTLRRDVETDGRHAEVAFTTDWQEDVKRRDFTMNTLLADTSGEIYDLTGEGVRDLQQGDVVFVGDAATRISEDYLRILRFFRFHAIYGSGEPDADALKSCAGAASHIKDLSRERITQEFLKILMAPKAVQALELMVNNGICADLPSADFRLPDFETLCDLEHDLGHYDLLTRLFLLLRTPEQIERAGANYLILPNKEIKELRDLYALCEAYADVDKISAKEIVYRAGTAQSMRFFKVMKVLNNAPQFNDWLAVLQTWLVPEFPLSGEDVMQAGIPKGPQVGNILRQVEDWWIAQDFRPDRQACLNKVEEFSDL